MLNPELDWKELAAEFSKDDRLRVSSVFKEDIAKRVQEIVQQHLEYELACVANGENISLSRKQLAEMSPDNRRALVQSMYQGAAQGVGFMYDRFHLSAAQGHDDQNHQFLHEFYAFLNSEEMFDFIKTVSGKDDVASADAQATRYTAGHYLTRHSDKLSTPARQLAYTIGFSEQWHPDWGGLLQFYENGGAPRNAWTPEFNTLSLFDIRHIHSVTYVTPFAAAPRLSITGWFHAAGNA